MIGKIKRVPLREVWPHEANDFTKWLEESPDSLGEIVGIRLSNIEREKDAGDFSVDLVAEDESGNAVIIENQLEKSNHDHLGKILTYLTALGAKTAIWIVSEARPEHIKAISWLNEGAAASFYLLKIEAIQIEDSKPAPLLSLIVGPSKEGRAIGGQKKEMAERYDIRERFWAKLLDYSATKTKLFANISPSQYSWIATGSGLRGVLYEYTVTQHEATVELYIDRGKETDEENLSIFQQLGASKVEIEKEFGGALEWQELEGRRACRIRFTVKDGGYRDPEEQWQKAHTVMVDAMIRLEKAVGPQIKKLKV